MKFPDSALLRTKIAFSFIQDVMNDRSDDPWGDTERAWQLATEAAADTQKSRLETLFNHWAMAILYQLHEGDFEKSVAEAEAVINIVPYDALAHADLGYFLANAGRTDRAVEWLETALRQEANPMDWYFGNLAVAYYLDNRPADAVAQFQKMKPFNINFAASYVRLGKIDEARKKMAEFLQKNPKWTIKNESMWPTTRQPQMIGPLLKGNLNDLAKAGLPEH